GMPEFESPVPGSNIAYIEVLLPDAAAEVWFDGRKASSAGAERTYHSPPLKPGMPYQYNLTAVWSEGGRVVTQERRVRVAAGKPSVVAFPSPSPAPLPAPAPAPSKPSP